MRRLPPTLQLVDYSDSDEPFIYIYHSRRHGGNDSSRPAIRIQEEKQVQPRRARNRYTPGRKEYLVEFATGDTHWLPAYYIPLKKLVALA